MTQFINDYLSGKTPDKLCVDCQSHYLNLNNEELHFCNSSKFNSEDESGNVIYGEVSCSVARKICRAMYFTQNKPVERKPQ